MPALIVCMGVSGSGKTAVAGSLADRLHFQFLEADDFHSSENKAWMSAGRPLDDGMRDPWIAAIIARLKELKARERSCVLSFSGLRRAHRERLRTTGYRTLFIWLQGPKELIRDRIASREGHFMPAALLDSQFDALELPLEEPDIAGVDISSPLPEIEKTALALAEQFLG